MCYLSFLCGLLMLTPHPERPSALLCSVMTLEHCGKSDFVAFCVGRVGYHRAEFWVGIVCMGWDVASKSALATIKESVGNALSSIIIH